MSKKLKPMNLSRKGWVLSLFLMTSCATQPLQIKGSTLYQWVEVGPESKALIRVVTSASVCPQVQLDETFQSMSPRGFSNQSFPVRVCELEVPQNVQSAKMEGKNLPLPKKNPKRILFMGDTGCRVKGGNSNEWIQACNDPLSWPFEKLAKKAAEWHPDLVIHVGDYIYRETFCPKGNAGCFQSPWGDRWDTWKADFLEPARSLLSASPWVFIRGNHESCKRSGEGWFRLLDPRPYSDVCNDYSDPYSFQANGVRMVVLDSSSAHNTEPSESHVEKFESQLRSSLKESPQPTWVLTHQPIWGVVQKYGSKPPAQMDMNKTLQNAVAKTQAIFDLVFSGHIHLFEVLRFEDSGPTQFILGNGGTELTSPPLQLDSIQIGRRKVKQGISIREFGYLTLEEKSEGQWDAVAFNLNGKILQKCRIQGPRVQCFSK